MKTNLKNKAIIISMVAVGAILMSACKKGDDTPIQYGNSYVRVLNTVSTSQPQDFYQADTKITTTAVAYGSASTSYYTIKGGPSNLKFKDAATGTTTTSANVGVEEGAYFTIFNYKDRSGNIQIGGMKDLSTLPAANKARVRFLNLAYSLNNSINVRYLVGGALIASSIEIGDTNYVDIDPNLDLGVTVIGSATTATIPGTNFVSGKIYTIWFDSTTATDANYHIIVQN
ncbi:MAG: DUF4397 domain-containing protein [Pedobacter sp.]|nr:DUF4397 domain-containing protein [Pedobacter sp.]